MTFLSLKVINVSMEKLKFIMLVHNHQPLGNFDYVMEKSYKSSYKPFLDIFSEFDLKISLHISGPLFDWLVLNHPEYIEKIKVLVENQRIEIIGSGYYEPILAAIPEEDAISQLTLYKKQLENTFKTKVFGAWLTERVWEPHLPKIFKGSGIRYTVTDDFHFLRSGFSRSQLDGYYLTDFDNNLLAVYPGSEDLRYIVPFSTIDNIRSYFRKAFENGIKTLIFADDGEKFGIWPETYKWVYEEGWLKGFFSFLSESKDWIEAITLNEHFTKNKPKGCCFLPTTSYPELGEWALPTKSSTIYRKNLDNLKNTPNFNEIKPFYQGGQWKNFLAKYRESRIMYRKMHYISLRLKNKSEKEKRHLFMSQCNDAYWHGIFGGLYLPHLRREINSQLTSAMKKAFKKREFDTYDIDLDGVEELIVKNESLATIVSPEDGGTLISIDFLEKSLNLTDVLTRIQEPYHLKLSETSKESGGTKTIHEQFKTKEAGLENLLVYDRHNKASFRTYLFKNFEIQSLKTLSAEAHPVTEKGYEWSYKSISDCSKLSLIQKDASYQCIKELHLKKNSILSSLEVDIENDYRYLGVEWNFNLFAPDADNRYILIDGAHNKPLNFSGIFSDFTKLSMIDEWYGIEINFDTQNFKYLVIEPIYTISLSESGVEKTFQGTSILLLGTIENGKFAGKTNITIQTIGK